MADKIISIKLILDKEKEFKNSLQQIGSEMKLLTAEAKKLQAQYAEEANTYDALAAKSKNLGAQYDELTKKLETQKKALENQRELKRQYEARTESLAKKAEEAAEAYKNAAEKTDKLKDAMREAKNAVNQNAQNIEKAESSAKRYERQIIETETAQILLGREIDKTSKYLQEAATSADGTAHSIDKYGKEVKDAAEDTKSFANAADLLAQAIVASGAVEGAEKLRDAIVDTANASIEYESAFAGVRKTVDGTAEELAAISDGIKGMATEIPIATTELAGIAEAAGQLGIETGSILGFTEVMAQLGVTTNLSANEAATALAKFVNITKMSESQYSNLGSSIVALGNNFATTEADIVAMATRLASTGEVVGLTEPQILAVATALSSVGIEAEAGGSAFSKLLKTIEMAVESGSKSVEDYARIAGKSVEEFSAAWREDAVSALSDFIDGLGRLEGSGTSAITVLNDLGLNEVRLSNAVLALASSEGILTEALDLSNSAWAENTALAEEAAIRYETTESKLQLLNNAVNNLKITMGDQLTAAIGEPLEALTGFVGSLDDFVQKYPGVTSAITGLAAGFGTLAVVGTVLPLIASLGSALIALPHGAAIAGIAALTVAIGTFAATLPKSTTETEKLGKEIDNLREKSYALRDSISDVQKAYHESSSAIREETSQLETAAKRVEELGGKTNLTAAENALLNDSIATLNKAFPEINLNYAVMSGNIKDVVINLRTLIETEKKYNELKAATEALIAAEDKTASLEADEQKYLDKKYEIEAALDVQKQLRQEYLEAWANGRDINDELESPYDKEIADLEAYLSDVSILYNNASELRRNNAERIENYNRQINNLDAEIIAKAEEFAKAMENLGAETEKGTETAAESFDKLMNELRNAGRAASDVMHDLDIAVTSGFEKGFVQKLYEGGAESQEILANLVDELNRLESEYGEGSEEVKAFVSEWNAAWSESASSTDELQKLAENLFGTVEKKSQAVKKATTSTKEAIDEAGKAIIEHAGTVKSNLEALTKEYDSAYKSARSSLGGIGGLFGEVAFKTDKSISDMISGLDSQANYFTGYMLNLQRAAQIGIDEGLVAALADGSDESAGNLQKIIDEFNKVAVKYGENSEEAEAFVTDFNTKFEATSKAKDALAATMAGIQTNFEERAGDILAQADDLITELSGYSGNAYDEVSKAVSETLTDIADGFTKFQVAAHEKSQGIIDAANYIKTGINTTLEVLPEEMKVAGQNVSLGLSEGILDKAGVLEDAVRRLAKEAIIGAAKDELGIHSPSEEGREIGKFFDEGIAQGIERNESTVMSANLKMISDLEARSQSAAATAGTALGNTMAKSMAAALQAGQALRQQVESGKLIVDGKVVQTAASVGIPSLTGQAAIDFNNEMKEFHNLPSDWSNQDIVDWLNGGGFHGSTGSSSSLESAIEQAVKNESANANVLVSVSHLGNKGADGKTWGYGSSQHYNPNLSDQNIGASRIVINQTFNGKTSYYDAKQGSKAGVQEATYY